VILLEVKSATDDDPKIFYEGIYEGDEGAVLVTWFN
jgi:hypothetical protein